MLSRYFKAKQICCHIEKSKAEGLSMVYLKVNSLS